MTALPLLLRLALFHILCLLLVGLAGPSWGQASLPERAELEARLEALHQVEGGEASEAARRDIEALQGALDGLESLAEVDDQLAELERRADSAPEELRQVEQELSAARETPPTEGLEDVEGLALDALERRLASVTAELGDAQDRLAEVETRLLGTQTLPERAQQAIAEATLAMEESRRALEELASQGVAEDAPRRLRHRIERALAERRLTLHQRELATNPRFRELAQQRRDLLQRRVARLEAQALTLRRAVEQRRREVSEQAIAEAVSDEPEGVTQHPLIQEAQRVNREMSLELLRATSRANDLERRVQEVRRRLDRVRQLQRGLAEHIEAIRGSPLLSRILREQRQALPRVETLDSLQEEIADLRLKQFELDRQRERLQDVERQARQRLTDAGVEARGPLVEPLAQLLRARRELVAQLEPTYGEMLTAAIELQLHQQQLLDTSRSLRNTLDEQLFWVANARPLDVAWLMRLPDHLNDEWQEGEWRRALPRHWAWPDAGVLGASPLLLLTGGLLLLRRAMQRRLKRLHGEIGRLHHDSQGHTPQAVALEALLALPGPLGLATLGLGLMLGGQGMAPGIGWSLLHLALAWAVLAWGRRLLVADGVAVHHFHWPAGYVARLRHWLGWLGLALVPVLFIGTLARDAAIDLTHRPVALGLLLVGLLGMSLALAKLILAHVPFFGGKLFRLSVGLAMALVPLILAGLVTYGYAYTALSLVGRFVITLYLLAVWILVEAAVVRGLAVAARRLAYRRALQRRRAQAQEAESAEHGLEVVEEPPLDMQQVNAQSLRLSKLFLMLGLLLVLYLVWADLLTVFGYLEQVMILGADGQEGSELVGGTVSVADVGIALLVVALTLMMARNLPGLLEVMVLSRLELKQGSAYAISSLLSYTIVGTGVVMALGTLGVSWSKLQWLVAALGVGLGFGLQEIFANFISGLIILFERPVRIGDTITLGNLTGTVNRIRIRATTVTDFDRKEIIIPNKTFVTDQLINWSLSDTITRVILTYGLAYGSDHRLVHRLLLQAAHENARVLDDPEPQAFFIAYGESSLTFELRIFVNSLMDRLHATDEVNGRVGELFAEHGLEIAFNQLDVRLRREDGTEVRLERTGNSQAASPSSVGAAGNPAGPEDGDGEIGR
ncbi:mechanosensitive channel MscK [Halomonas beimenensis]|uniref:Potassium efflux system KefA protein / Small-conductance mechanosensitive channel n=1 Tax=Halomonas beimenensis TaxID=475662 RepID=A0A291P8P5_9GAMM|nr:mechanosensitive channel MscK [Halomonas beimenensis]ATJ83293.1 potassium efflux system KefA protein / Small-conductance mechanosensitive channel [Halomonas beimenensis]